MRDSPLKPAGGHGLGRGKEGPRLPEQYARAWHFVFGGGATCLEACESAISCRDGASSDELCNALGLGKVEAAVEECPQGELPSIGEAAACSKA